VDEPSTGRPKLGVGGFFRKLAHAIFDQRALDSAAQVSFYLLFSLFPFLFFVVTLTAYLPLRSPVDDLIQKASLLMPPQAMTLITDQLHNLIQDQKPKLLTLGLVVAIYSASRGVDAFRSALNLAYDVPEHRSFIHTQLVAIGMTLVGSVLTLVAFAGMILGGRLGGVVAAKLHVGQVWAWLWSWLRFPISTLIVMFVVALGYYFLPDVKQKFRFITPGSVIGTVLWIVATWGFTFYSDHFGHYNVTYGSLGGVILLMTWFYISSLVFIAGGEINAILEHASADGKVPGARRAGEAPLPEEARASRLPPGATKGEDSARRHVPFWRRFRPQH
jgi:membrane protein